MNKTLPYNAKDREFLKKTFEKDLSGGLTESKLKSKMGKIKYGTKDEVDSFGADKIKTVFWAVLRNNRRAIRRRTG